MPYQQHAIDHATDQARILALVGSAPETMRHVIDLPYRLAAPSAQVPENTCMWAQPDGTVVGFAIIQRQFWSIDYGIDPAHPDVFAEILAWADARMRSIATEERADYPDGIMNFFDCYSDDTQHQAELTANGYENYPEWTQVHRWQTLDHELVALAPPPGFVVRPLAGASEAGDYAALQRLAFDSTNMTADWRLRTLQAPHHVPELDLVMAAPTGELVAFCLGWQMDAQGQVEPIGVHPDFQQHGLGRVMLRTCLRRMRARGITTAHIEHDGTNDSATQLYASEGFAHPRLVQKYMRRWHASP